jgi:hypothetical protein
MTFLILTAIFSFFVSFCVGRYFYKRRKKIVKGKTFDYKELGNFKSPYYNYSLYMAYCNMKSCIRYFEKDRSEDYMLSYYNFLKSLETKEAYPIIMRRKLENDKYEYIECEATTDSWIPLYHYYLTYTVKGYNCIQHELFLAAKKKDEEDFQAECESGWNSNYDILKSK